MFLFSTSFLKGNQFVAIDGEVSMKFAKKANIVSNYDIYLIL